MGVTIVRPPAVYTFVQSRPLQSNTHYSSTTYCMSHHERKHIAKNRVIMREQEKKKKKNVQKANKAIPLLSRNQKHDTHVIVHSTLHDYSVCRCCCCCCQCPSVLNERALDFQPNEPVRVKSRFEAPLLHRGPCYQLRQTPHQGIQP